MRKVGWRAMQLLVSCVTKPTRGEAATRATSPGGHAGSPPAARAAAPGAGLVTAGSESACVCSSPVRGPYPGLPDQSWRRSSTRAFRLPRKPRRDDGETPTAYSHYVLGALKCSAAERSASIVFPRFHRKHGMFPAPVDLYGGSMYF